MITKSILVLWAFILFIQPLLAQTIPKDRLDSLIGQGIEGLSPGVAVGVVKQGSVVYEKYTGYSNLEHRVAINEKTRFNIASNAKQFTALCILKLAEEGKLNLEDDLRAYLPDFYENQEAKITLAHLLTHTSGLRDVYDLWALQGQTWWQSFVGNAEALELIQSQKDLNFEPGTEYLYSNSNYLLLAEIVEKVSGKKFDDYAQNLFQELGMANTSFLSNYMEVIPHKARPYGNWNGWKEYPTITEIHGDGGLFSTLKDQLMWEMIIQRNKGRYIPQKLIYQSQQLIPGSEAPDYGYGLMFGEYKGLDYAYHDGQTGAYGATVLRFAEQGLSVVVISNSGNVSTNYVAKKLADAILGLEVTRMTYPSGPEKIEKKKDFSELTGIYQTTAGTIIKISEKEGSLYREIYQRDPVKLIPETGNLFYYESNQDLKIAFTHDGEGQKKFTIYLSSQEPNTALMLPSYSLNKHYKNSLNGCFYNDETQTEIAIRYTEGDIYTITKNGREQTGELIYKDLLQMGGYEIKINRDGNDAIQGLLLSSGRVRNVQFLKRE